MMANNWKEIRLGEIVDVTQGLAINVKTKHLLVEIGLPLLRITDLFHDNYSQFINKDKVPKQCIANHNEIIYTRTGQVGYVFKNKTGVVHNNCFKVTPKDDRVDRNFIYWFLYQKSIREYANLIASGSVQKDLTHAAFNSIKIKLPDLKTQCEIAVILNALEKRIENLNEMNQTLENIAQALFKSWFVDFDPVRAKAEGREPEGLDPEVAALFPDSFEESEIGPVPKGWKVRQVLEVADIVKGKSYKSSDLVTECSSALVTLKSFARGGGFRMDGFKPYIGDYKPEQVLKPGDLIVAYTDVTQAAELIGKPAIVIGTQRHNILVASLDVGIIRPNFLTTRQFLYGLFNQASFQSHTLAHTSGTTVLHLSKDAIGSFRFACPDIDSIRVFNLLAELVSSKCQLIINQMQSLTELRDSLLPKLITGQLNVVESKYSDEVTG
jgi:type I restriction enzyme S subunit